jgi:hypothetical protein
MNLKRIEPQGEKPTSRDLESRDERLKRLGVSEGANLGASVLAEAVGKDNCNLFSHIVKKSTVALAGKAEDCNLALESINAEEPKDAVEVRLISQANALYSQGMGMLMRLENAERMDFMREYGNLAIKLMRAHNETIEALSRYRRGGEQKVTVVHLADRMAVVNNYGRRGGEENQGDTPCSD